MSVNTGKYVAEDKIEGDSNALGIRESRENDKIDSKYGFDRIKDTQERTGYLINMHSTEILDEDRRLVAALDLFFIQMDGSRFKASVVYEPYFLVLPSAEHSLEVARYLQKKFTGHLSKIEHIKKDDLDMPNHLIGLKQNFLKLSFANTTAMNKVRREIMAVVRKNREREKSNTNYIKLLSSSLAHGSSDASHGHGSASGTKSADYLDYIVDIREYDVPYHVRVSIDLKVNCGLWYDIRCRPGGLEMPLIKARPDILDRPEAIVLAYDIETTKLPLKFPDAQTDQIMMISYMIDGQGYLITNREIISCDVNDFEYTPKPEFEGNFIVFNEADEMGVIQKFFDHILEVKPHIIVSYNGDFFDWPFVETRAAVYDMDMKREIGFSKNRDGNYLSRPSMHMDCLCWVKRDSYLPVGSQGLKAVAKAKLRYDPVELDPEEMCKMAVEQPQVLSNYSVSDAVATYYLYMKYVNPFIFALTTIIPMEPDEVLRKGSGTLCETLLMVQAFHANIVFPNKQQSELNKLSDDGHVLDSETYVGGHVEALESGVFRADIPCRFRLDQEMVQKLQNNIDNVLKHAIEVEENVPLDLVTNLSEVATEIRKGLQELYDTPNRLEQPVIFHLDVGAMYPNIILTNRLQPSSMVNETDCAACDFNRPDAECKRVMDWMWRGEMLPATKNEYQRIQQQLETEKFPPLFPNGPTRAFHELSKEDQAAYEKKRLNDYCRKAYKKTKITRLESRKSTVCQKENSFYVDTVRAFRDRRYEYKGLTKVAKAAVVKAVAGGDASEIKAAQGREVLYDSLQLAHKCILNSFYGYVMRRGARWHSMSMAGIVCLTGANIIRKAREIVERVGRPLELDTDGIWCIVPASFPQEFTIHTTHEKKKKFNISYPNAVLNTMVKDHFTNDQYHELVKPSETDDSVEQNGEPKYMKRSENSIFFEVDGPYLAMVLPAAKEEGKKLKKRYAVFNFDGSLAELKGFEVKRRGELQLIKIFQSSVFEAFLHGTTLEECYASVAKVADYWLDVLYSKGSNMPDSELFELISENRSMSRKLEDYGAQKSTSISTAKRLAEFLGDQMVKDAGLACKYIISKKPEGSPVTERAIPLAIFQSEPSVRRHFLRRWLKDNTMGDADIRDVLDWNYYIERLGGTIQKIITIPAALQGVSNPVPRIQHPDWLHKRMLEKNDVLKQRRINEMFTVKPKPIIEVDEDASENDDDNDSNADNSNDEEQMIRDMEDIGSNTVSAGRRPIVHQRRKRNASEMDEQPAADEPKTWREACGPPPQIGDSREQIQAWIEYHKKKWRWQIQQRNMRRSHQNNKKSRNEPAIQRPLTIGAGSSGGVTIGGFLRRTQRSIIEQPWQIIQIVAVDELGTFTVWAIVGTELHKIKLNIPRIFYVNKRTPAPNEDGSVWKQVHRTLPRSRPIFHLYQYIVAESIFKENRLGMLADLAAPDIEGIYETQMSLEFRALIQLGALCHVQRSVAREIAAKKTNAALDSFSIEQLEMMSVSPQQTYLAGGGGLKRLFLYQHSSSSGKRELWGLFIPTIKKGIVIFLDTVRTNQMSNMKNFYLGERSAYSAKSTQGDAVKIPPEDMQFEVFFEVDTKLVYRHITHLLNAFLSEKKGPALLCVQAGMSLNKLNLSIPVASEFPQTQIFIVDDASLLTGLDWQRNGTKSMLRHFLNLNSVVDLMLEQCRYYHLPIGNMPADPIMFGADVFFARSLQKHNFVLWASPTSRPDLGGREVDDNRLLSEFEESITVVQNNRGFYEHVCVELAIDSLAVTALLQASKIQEIEGASSAITFDVIPQASLEDMIANNPSASVSNYDESALCSAALKVMRSMVNCWLREVAIDRNVFADFQIVHFYRWIRSSTSLLYDPAMRRNLNNLMQKIFLQIITEFQRLNAKIVYADFNRIILNSGKKSIVDAISYVEYVVQSIRNKELFHSINLTYQQSWKFLLWMDTANYAGQIAEIPKELQSSQATQNSESTLQATDADADEVKIDMNWNIAEQLPEDGNCRAELEAVLRLFMDAVINTNSLTGALESIPMYAYEIVQRLHKGHAPGKSSPATQFANALVEVLSTLKDVDDEVQTLRRNMLRLIGLGEFSDLAKWQEKIHTYVLTEVICKACNQCRDIDLCKDKDRATVNDVPVWLCSQCYVYYENEEIEIRLLDVIHRKIMSYTLQDLRCTRCKEIKQDNLAELCACAGTFDTLIDAKKLRQLLQTFLDVAETHEMHLLKDEVQIFLNNSY